MHAGSEAGPAVPPAPRDLAEQARLDVALLAAHRDGDEAALVRLYTLAADRSEAEGRTDAACFYLTHAYVFALASGAPDCGPLNLRLWRHGREIRHDF